MISDRGSIRVFMTLGCVQLTDVINWHFGWLFGNKDRCTPYVAQVYVCSRDCVTMRGGGGVLGGCPRAISST